MAFRATRTTAVKKKTSPILETVPAAQPAVVDVPSASALSIEDLVGVPASKTEQPHEEPPSHSPITPAPSISHPQNSEYAPSRSGYHQNQAANNGDRQMHYRRSFSNQRRPYGSGGGRYGSPPPRHQSGGDIGNSYSTNTYTQDINVPTESVKGMLDIMPEGHGFLRPKFTPGDRDIYISQSQIRRFLLRNGDIVEGQARPPKENERYWGLLKVETVDDLPADQMEKRPKFEDLTPIYPNKHLKLETGQIPLSSRIIDLLAPIGFGQRGLIVSPPKAGKTTILKEIAAGVSANYPDVHLMAALIGERPEEVTDISRNVQGEVLASNFDESPSEQTRIAEVALERAKRLVELGRDVVILLDSITRLARAYNLVVNPSGRTLSGGFDPAALYPAKRFLGAARCVEPSEEAIAIAALVPPKRYTIGGSLTVIGTALVDTGSRMDDLIYEEFKGTGNMELHLSRILQERRVFPAIDAVKSGTRHDELLLGEDMMKKVGTLRHMLSLLSEEERTMMLVDRLGKTKINLEFLDSLSQG